MIRLYFLVSLLFLFLAEIGNALPIGFGRNQGDLDYSELRTKNFYIYHDSRTPHEASMTLNSLEAARSVIERWFKVKRTRPLPVIMSATTENASFANFITDAVELQTMGLGYRDLIWHEYVHSMMYRYLDNWLGPAGSVIHLMWMPSWWVEGLAEALTVSEGSDIQAGIERYQALSGDWPTYEKLHSLYESSPFSFRGYATSGAFVSFILQKMDANQIDKFHDDFYYRSMPWWWPWIILPVKDTLPMDHALKNFTKEDGEELYKKYRQAATDYWKNNTKGQFYSPTKTKTLSISSAGSLRTEGNAVFKIGFDTDGTTREKQLSFSNRWASSEKDVFEYPIEPATFGRLLKDDLKAFVVVTKSLKGTTGTKIILSRKDSSTKDFVLRHGFITHLFENGEELFWLEQEQETTRFCHVKKLFDRSKPIPSKLVKCPLTAVQPRRIDVLGESKDEAWLRHSEQTLYGDREEILVFDLKTKKIARSKYTMGGNPVSFAVAGNNRWLLVAEKTRRTLRRVDQKANCLGVVQIANIPYSIRGLSDGSLVMPLFLGNDTSVLKLAKTDLIEEPCYKAEDHTSPLMYAVANGADLPLSKALSESALWNEQGTSEGNSEPVKIALKESALPLDQDKRSEDTPTESKPAKWRGRPVVGVPWIGGDSAGYQFGILSVPLMDHMQNETVRLYAAYGIDSRFPDYELSVYSNRFWPTLVLDGFRYQTWNGEFKDPSDKIWKTAYLDERGVRFTSQFYLVSLDTTLSIGTKYSRLKPYISHPRTRTGVLNEPFFSISKTSKIFWNLSLNLHADTRGAPASINDDFAYDVVGGGASIARSFVFLSSSFNLGVEGSRTRGPRRRELQEVYRPLRVYVPGGGASFNNIHLPIIGNGSLFDPVYGENQLRGNLNWTMPLIREIDKLIRLFYLERLDFTAFVNYGGAWNGEYVPKSSGFLFAHGYNFDLQFNLKGINFNVGTGIGQVTGNPFELYGTFGFDAIF